MAELAWPTDLGHGTFVGRFGFMDADGPDPDRSPDITSATGGTVEIAPSVSSIRYTGTGGPMILAARTAKGIIDSEGYLCTVAANGGSGVRGMVFPATDDTDLSPTDWSYRVTVRLEGGITLSPFNVKLPTGATVDLSLATPVSASGGTAVVVDTATADRAVQAAAAAEASAVKAAGYATGVTWSTLTGKPAVFTPATHAHAWADITGKPSTFTPATHSHAWGDVTGKPTTFAPAAHDHTVTDVTGLQTALDGKASTTHGHAWTEVTGKPTTFTPSAHTHTIANVTGLQAALDAKATEQAVTLARLPAGLSFTVMWNGTAWTLGGTVITSRPTPRTDLTMHAYGGTVAPAFAVAGDLWTEDAG